MECLSTTQKEHSIHDEIENHNFILVNKVLN